ncbi:MAG TPA: WcaI family glycosyltransferase [Pedobacter sp.]|jgi:colanic acid biosynthesis glycosyl transferase WcaI
MNSHRILLIGGNYSPEQTGIGKYNGEMMEWLSGKGFDCTVITTYPYYPFWKIQEPYVKNSGWFKKEQKRLHESDNTLTIYRCPHYVPSTPSGFKRILSDLTFFISAFIQIIPLLFHKKYDFIISVVPPFQLGLLGLFYKLFRGGKVIYHIQDLQIDAAHSLGMIKSRSLVKLMYGVERFILKNSDYVSSISDGMIKNIKAKHDREILMFPNWANTNDFYPNENKEKLKKEFGLASDKKVVLYSGAIGEKQGLDMLLYCAKDLKDNTEIQFVICGSGPYKQRLIELVKELQLSNVVFMPLQPKEKFNNFLNMADVHLVLQKADATDLVMPSKVTNILSVGGLALITTPKNNSLHSVISQHNMGILIEPENQELLTAGIQSAIINDQYNIKNNARKFAEENLKMDNILTRYFTQLTKNNILTRAKSGLVSG